MEKKVEIEEIIKNGCPDYAIVYLEADVENRESDELLKEEFGLLTSSISENYTIGDINKRPTIAATRKAYKIFGKDPNRYRPSQEQLMRRVVRGLGLYFVNALVDAGNLLSLETGCSVGVFDRDRIEGDTIRVGVGRPEEPYIGIGRGPLNIDGLPVIRDDAGGFGTPTSDCERTKTELSTKRISATVHIFDCKNTDIDAIMERLKNIFVRYTSARNIEVGIYR